MSYEPLTKEPAALMDDRVQEAAIESINRNFSADTLDDTVYFANARMIAEEQDRVQRAQAERMAAAGRLRKMNNGEYIDRSNRTVYKDNMFTEKALADEKDYGLAKKLGFSRRSWVTANEFLENDSKLKNLRSMQENYRRNGMLAEADAFEPERQVLESEQARRIASLGANANKLRALTSARKTGFEQFLNNTGLAGLGNWMYRKLAPQEALDRTLNPSAAEGEAVKPLDSYGTMPLEKRGAWENFKETFRKENIPLVGNFMAIGDNVNLAQAAQRLQLGEDYYRAALRKQMPNAPEQEIEVLAANAHRNDRDRVLSWNNERLEHERRGDTWWGETAKTIGDSGAFMTDLAASAAVTGGLASILSRAPAHVPVQAAKKTALQLAREAMKASGKDAASKAAKHELFKQAGKEALKEAGKQQLKWAPQTAVSGIARGTERYAGETVHADHAGNVGFDSSVEPGEKLLSGVMDSGIENLSESSGELIGLAVPRWARKISGKVARKVLPRVLSGSGARKLEKTFRKLSGFNGTLGEMAEERVGDVLRGAVGLNSNEAVKERIYQEWPTWRQLGQEFTSFLMQNAGTRLSAGAIESLAKRLHREVLETAEEMRVSPAEGKYETGNMKYEMGEGAAADAGTRENGADAHAGDAAADAGTRKEDGRVPTLTPISELGIDPQRFQFKSGADKKGVTRPLQGAFDQRQARPLYVWEDKDGKKYVVEGHHRLDLAQRSGVQDVLTYVDRESEGVTAEQARTKGVWQNIKDGKGSISDFADYFRGSGLTEEQAKTEGLFTEKEGRTGFVIGKNSGETLWSAFKNGLAANRAEAIASVAQGDEGLEAVGVKAAERMSEIQLREYLKFMKGAERKESVETGDLFGFDDSAMRLGETLSRIAAKRIKELDERLRSAKGALRNPDGAAQVDVKVGKNAQKLYDGLIKERQRWENWTTDAELRKEMLSRVEGSDGKDDAAHAADPATAGVNEALRAKYGDGVSVTRAKGLNKIQEAVKDFFWREFNTEVEFFDTENLKADGFRHGGTIWLNRAGRKPMLFSAFHEFAHKLRTDSPEAFRKLTESVTALADKGKYSKWQTRYNAKYRKAGYAELDEGALAEEFISDVVGSFGAEEDFLKELAGQDKSVLERFLEWIEALREALLGNYKPEARKVIDKELDRVRREVMAALRAAEAAEGKYETGNMKYEMRGDAAAGAGTRGKEAENGKRLIVNGINVENIFGNIGRYFSNTKDALRALYRKALLNRSENKSFVNFADVTESEREMLSRLCGADFSGALYHGIDEAGIRHLNNRHGLGNETRNDQEGITEEDVTKIPDIISGTTPRYIGKNEAGNHVFEYSKNIGSDYFYLEEYRNGRGKLSGATLWKKKGTTAAQPSMELHDESPTPEALRTRASDSTITSETEKSRDGEEKKSSKTRRELAGEVHTIDDYCVLVMRNPGLDASAKKDLLKRFALDQKMTLKEAEELLEYTCVQSAREIASDNSLTEREKYNLIVKMYEDMPLLNMRTSTSIENQAYSTPLPLAYMLGRAVLVGANRIYEPTAGNGALVLTAEPGKVHANEIETGRLSALRESGFAVTSHDAAEYVPEEKSDAVIMNPPFGRLKEKREFEGTVLWKLEHLIALNALKTLTPDGRAAMILGAADKLTSKVNKSEKPFLNYLYDHFDIADSFEVSGELFKKQGAGYPVRVIILNGRKEKSDFSDKFSETPVERLADWSSIYERLKGVEDEINQRRVSAETGLRENAGSGVASDVAGRRDSADRAGAGEKTAVADRGTDPSVHRGEPSGRSEAGDGAGAGGASGASVRGVGEPGGLGGRSASDHGSSVRTEDGGGASGVAEEDGSGRDGGHRSVHAGGGEDVRSVGGEAASASVAAAGGSKVSEQSSSASVAADGRSKEPSAGGAVEAAEAAEGESGADAHAEDAALTRTQGKGADAHAENADTREETSEDGLQNRYKPKSHAESLGTMVPKFMRSESEAALANLEKKHGSVDEFVKEELGYSTLDEMYKGLAAEQIDGVALAIDNIRNGDSIVIGDQTGIGKGRQAAAVMRYAKRHGILPIFVTEKPKLFSDMYFDGLDIGEQFNPFLIGNDTDSSVMDRENNVVKKAMTPNAQKAYFPKMLEGNPKGFDCVFITYSQVNKEGEQQKFLRNLLANRNAMLVMDEAHNASGAESNTGAYFQGLLKHENLKGAMFLSATYAKRPDNMILFALRNELGKIFNGDQLVKVIKKGGLALQQIISQGLAQAGQLIRRERDFTGVKMNIGEAIRTTADVKRQYDEVAGVMADIVQFSDEIADRFKEEKKRAGRKADESMRANNFSSMVHNYIGQLLFATKLDAAADEVIKSFKAGQKPVIALANTLETFLKEYADEHGVKTGDRIDVTFRDVLLNALEKMQTGRMENRNGKSEEVPLEFNARERSMFNEIKERIERLNLNLPASPIDYLKAKLTAAGLRVGEITGRQSIINYDANGENGVLAQRDTHEKNRMVNDFNNGALDALILNRSGSTGLSLHSSARFKDQKQRHMFVVQADLDINVVMQMLGRVLRSGQVNKPEYTFLSTDLTAERRVTSILQKKFASLSANTTANTKGSMSFGGSDILNKYGDQVVAEYLSEHLNLAGRVGLSPEVNMSGKVKAKEDLARSFTGKMALLPDAMQSRIYADLDSAYDELVTRMKAIGEYDLEITEQDWHAEEKSSEVYEGGDANGGLFHKPLMLKTFHTRERRRVPDRKALEADRKKQFGTNDIMEMREKIRNQFKEQRDAAARYFEEKIKDSPGNAAGLSKQKMEALKNLRQAENETLNLIGYPVVLQGGETAYRGTLSYVAFSRGNPGAASNIKFSFLTESPLRMTIPFSQYGKKAEQISAQLLPDRLEDIFTESSTRIIEADRRVYTGNLLRGVDASEGHGRIVKFTLSDGRVETGVVLPQEFSMSSLTHDPRRKLSNLQEVERYLDAGNWRTRVTGDYGLELSRNAICVDVKRGSGGNIYLDADIRAITGDFVRTGSRMRASLNESQFQELVPLLLRKTQLSGDLELMNKLRESSGDVKLDIQEEADRITQTFNSELERQIRGELPSDHIYQLGRPSDILLRSGIPNLNIELSASRLKQKAESGNHPFSIGDIRNLPDALRNPIAIFAYGDRRKAQNIIVDIQNNGNDFLVGLTLNYNHDGINVNSIRGLFPKDTANWLNWIQQGKALYLDKERVQNRIAQQRTNSADVSYLDLNSIENIVRDFRKVKGGTENIPLSIQSPEISDAVTRGLKWFSRAVKYSRMKDSNGKTDISKFATLFQTVMYYSEKIPAFKKIFDYGQRYEDDVFHLKEEVFGENEQDLLRVKNLGKGEYAKFAKYIFQRDVDASGYSVRPSETKKGWFEVVDPNGHGIGTVENEASAWNTAWEAEADMLKRNGESAAFADAVLAYRVMNARVYALLKNKADALKEEYEENDIPISEELTDIFTELQKMGDRRGYYMARIRHGEYILEANKDGENPRLEIFDTIAGRAARAATLEAQGYKIEFRHTATPSNSVFEDMALAGMNDIFTSAMERVTEKAKKDFDGFGLHGTWMEYPLKKGGTERHFVVRGSADAAQRKMFVANGGYFDRKMKEWHFPAPKCGYDVDKVLLEGLNSNSAEMQAALEFGKAFASQVSVLIHSHGSRSKKIRRDDRRGGDVYLGYEEDPLRALVMSASATASGTAKGLMARRMMEAFTGRDLKWKDYMKEHMPEGLDSSSAEYYKELAKCHKEYEKEVDRRRIDSAKQPEAYKDAKSYIQEMLRNQEASERVFGFVRGIAALKYLSRISTSVVNLTTLLTNVPAVFHAEGRIPFHSTLKGLGRASAEYAQYRAFRDFGKGKRPSTETLWLFNEISRRGWETSLVNQEATGVLRTWFGNGWKWVAEKMMLGMELTERFNRAVTIAAAYRQLVSQHKGGELSGAEKESYLKQAKEMSDKAHGIYGKTNLPSWARGTSVGAQALRAFYVFKPYGHNYMQELYNIGFNQRDMKGFAWMLLSPMILAGPTATVAWNLMPAAVRAVCAVFGIEPPDDPEEALYRWVEDEFGGYAGRVSRYGALGLAGINIAPSMSMMFTRDSVPRTIWDLFGAPGSAVKDVAEGTASLARGDVLKGAEALSPALLSAPIRAYREYKEGVTTRDNQPVFYGNEPLKSTAGQSLIRMFGFNPAGIAEKRDRQWSERMTAREYSEARTEIYARLRRYYLNPKRTQADFAELADMIRAYNARVRRSRPHGVTLITSRQLRSLRKKMVVAPKRERGRRVSP